MRHFLVLSVAWFISTAAMGQIDVILALPSPCTGTGNEIVRKERGELHLTIHPNPAQGDFVVQIASNQVLGKLHLEILNLQGQILYTGEFCCDADQYTRLLSGLPLSAGFYYLSIRNDGHSATRPLVLR